MMSILDEQGFATIQRSWMQPQQQGADDAPAPESGSPTPAPEPSGDLAELYQRAMAAAGTDEFAELMEAYIEAASQEDGAKDTKGFWRPRKDGVAQSELAPDELGSEPDPDELGSVGPDGFWRPH